MYANNIYQQSLKSIARYINKGLKWNDIGDASALERFRLINGLISKSAKGHYNFRLIAQSEPQIGFILLTYKDGTMEVLFNGISETSHKIPLFYYQGIQKYLQCLQLNIKVYGELQLMITIAMLQDPLHRNSDFAYAHLHSSTCLKTLLMCQIYADMSKALFLDSKV